ncbi:flagellar biosynthesis anti-sigma factor FlgM [Chloroflexi bacterium CFX6]|nr:flagellar biosynthesis anti-sigma factor FlgM [Chloroflexi bacterium CFX6]
MKIENANLSPLSSKPADAARRVERKDSPKDVSSSVRAGQDTAEMSEEARLLAKARAALGSVEETDAERLAALRKQIESGDYTVQVSELARKLIARLYPK